MKAPGDITVYLKNYKAPHFRIETVDLNFDLHEDYVELTNSMSMRRDLALPREPHLELMGEELQLTSVRMNDQVLDSTQYLATPERLTILNPPDTFTLEVVTRLKPQLNTELQGLYKSGGMFCTQNEPEGFRRMTYFLDRPDIMAVYTTRIEADQVRYPILLANGNRTDAGLAQNGRHWVKWHDPFKKPSYLFALVAGDLGKVSDSFTTRSGRRVTLEIYVNHGNESRCTHAMESLKRSMRWDEERFGLEYDLDIFMIVAVDDFNSGAMENKGLNIFNSKYVLADAKVATDVDYEQIEGIIAHEYFHNWTGNRVTCRDWFQLSLKEGLTVFRDQEFSADMGAAAVRRITEVVRLRTFQFPEDAGPMAHPIRPASYMEINNFYTTTVYEKGAEVIRMIQTLVGRDGFRKGIDKYFELFDGQAVTTEDFIHAMEVANKIDLTQFKLWYNQAGTPTVTATSHYDEKERIFTLTLSQSCRPTPETVGPKQPFHIPVRVGLLNSKGDDMIESQVLNLKADRQEFQFKEIEEKPVASILRGFSAPVILNSDLTDQDLMFLMAHDSDPFNRWDSSQQVIHRQMLALIKAAQSGQPLQVSSTLIEAFRSLVKDEKLEPAFRGRAMILPAESVYQQMISPVDPVAIHQARSHLLRSLGDALSLELEQVYSTRQNLEAGESYSVVVAGERAFKNQALSLLCATGQAQYLQMALSQLSTATNMTDEVAALSALASNESPLRQQGLDAFYNKWKHEPLVVNKWLQVQASAPISSALSEVQKLVKHPAFDIRNPNKVYSLLMAFGRDNLFGFHGPAEQSYAFMADQILALDALNPQVASRVSAAFTHWRLFDETRRALMETQLKRLHDSPKLSKNVYEIVAKALAN